MKNTWKKFIACFMVFSAPLAFACEACKLQQPKVTQNLTHGTGPDSQWDWLIVAVIAAITIYTFIFSLKYLLKPGEEDKNHIKHSILN